MTPMLMKQKDWTQDVFEESMTLYYKRILYFLERTLKDPAKAEDLTQETFLKLYHQLDRREQPDQIVNWLYRVATNLCRDYWRSSSYQKEAPYIIEFGERAITREEEQDPCVWGERREALQDLLNELPLHYVSVIQLRFFQELRLDEVAEAIDCPLGTVKSRLFNGLRVLRKKIQENGRDPNEFYDFSRR